jgi:uncharacterized membrane protein
MASLTVWKFDTVDGASNVLHTLESLQKQQLIKIADAAIVYWPVGKKSPKTKQLANLAGIGALTGAFWGMLFGLIFFIPFFGLAVGAAIGALAASFADFGISDEFIKEVRTKVTEGTSALFIMADSVVEDKVAEALKGTKMELIKSNLTAEQEEALRKAFSSEE